MALDLLQSPSSVKILRAAPLPPDVVTILRIAAGDEEASSQAADATRHSPKSIREAAAFYIEQILLHPDADYYRVLGARPDASTAELRRNMALLIRWLHPDRQNGAERSIFTARVTKAWSELKTEDGRAAYDLLDERKRHRRTKTSRSRRASASPTVITPPPDPLTSLTDPRASTSDPGILMRMLLILFGRALP